MLKYVQSTCALMALGALSLAAQVTNTLPAVQTTGMIGVADAQTAQLNLLNPGVLAPAVGVMCKANVSFVDAGGTTLKSATLTISPGQSQSFSLRSDVDLNLVSGARREIRAVISIPPIATPVASTAAAVPACKVIPTLEILDTVSGRTLVILGHAKTIPSVVAATPQ